MKRYRDMILTSSDLDASSLARYVEAFADQSQDWEFPSRQSSLYEQACGKPSCCIIYAGDAPLRSAIHMTRNANNSLYVANIIPLACSELTPNEYNALVGAFAGAFRAHTKRSAAQIRVTLSKADVGLADIVPGKIPKSLLDRYLAVHPLSYHPSDIGRLDAFICSLSRYSRKQFDIDAFETLLIEELGWSSNAAKWCRSRVEIGLAVLAINKKFYV